MERDEDEVRREERRSWESVTANKRVCAVLERERERVFVCVWRGGETERLIRERRH